MAVPYNRKQLIQRIRKHMNNGFPNDAFATSDNEIMLYIDSAIAFGLVGQAWGQTKITGVMEIPEAYLVTYQLPDLQQDDTTGYWFSTLLQPPVGLALGYSISQVYPAKTSFGKGDNFLPIKNKRVSYRNNMPMPPGGRYWVENNTIWLAANNNTPLLGVPFYVQMPTTRTTDITQDMNLPDDVIASIFDQVTKWLTQRYAEPKDIVNDDLPAGRNNINAPVA